MKSLKQEAALGFLPLMAWFFWSLLPCTQAQSLSSQWFKIAGGGGASSNGALALTGTIGQHDAQTFAKGNLMIVGGFWGSATNQAPRAATLVYGRAQGISLKINVVEVLTNCTDPQGLSLSLRGASVTSANGVTLFTNSTTIFYAPTGNTDDSFTYTIANSQGATSTGLVLIQMVSVSGSNTVVRLQTGFPGSGTNTLTFAGIPGYQYIAQFATNLTTSPWFDFSTNAAGTNGLWQVIDPTATNAQRYYRVRTP